MRLVIFSAFPQELKPLLRKFEIHRTLRHNSCRIFFIQHSLHEILLVQTGMGYACQKRAFEYIIEKHFPDCILSIGFGGALYAHAEIGELVWGTKLLLLPEEAKSDRLSSEDKDWEYVHEIPDTEGTFQKLSSKINIRKGAVITLKKQITKSLVKGLLPHELPCPVCDMETFFLSTYSSHKGLPFYAIRAVTDRLDEEIPSELFTVVDEAGNYSLARTLKLLMFKPGLIPEAVKLGKHSNIAAAHLSHAVTALINILTTD